MKNYILVAAIIVAFSGCASVSPPADTLDELKKICESVVPCEPCPECPKCPEAPPPQPEKPPVPQPPVEPKPESCDRDGLPPDGAFVWVPMSSRQTLAIVTPHYASCENGLTVYYGRNKSESGRHENVRANGCRLTWRFTKPGSAYGMGIRVVCSEANGTKRIWKIPHGASRFEDRSGK